MSAPDLYKRRFLLFSGKGGVGKTAVSSSFALSCARRGEKTLLIELNVKNKTSSLFGVEQIDEEIREVDENLFAVNVTPKAAMREYALMVLKIKLVYRAVFENRIVSSFLKVIPGLNELVMLGKAYYHAVETDEEGNFVWDKVIVDAPATGHGIFFLKIPSVITNLISSGLMYDEAKRILDLLQDQERTAFAVVTLAEDMPVNETLMLTDVVEKEMAIPVACVFANGIYRPLFDEAQAEFIEAGRNHLQKKEESAETSTLQGFLEAAHFRNDRVSMQQHYLKKLRAESDWPLVEIPFYFHDRMSFAVLDGIAQHLDRTLRSEPDEESSPSATESAG